MMENVKWLIQKKGVFIIELLVIVIAFKRTKAE